jgi:DNA repair protein RadC
VFGLLLLDSQNRLIAHEQISLGTINCAAVYPREVARYVLAHNAAAVLLCHGHPSGVCEPSQADELLTRTLRETLALLDVHVLDHIIVAGTQTLSMAECGRL